MLAFTDPGFSAGGSWDEARIAPRAGSGVVVTRYRIRGDGPKLVRFAVAFGNRARPVVIWQAP